MEWAKPEYLKTLAELVETDFIQPLGLDNLGRRKTKNLQKQGFNQEKLDGEKRSLVGAIMTLEKQWIQGDSTIKQLNTGFRRLKKTLRKYTDKRVIPDVFVAKEIDYYDAS